MSLEDGQDATAAAESAIPERNPLTPDWVRIVAEFVKNGSTPDISSDLIEDDAGEHEISICKWPITPARRPKKDAGETINGYLISAEETHSGEVLSVPDDATNPLEKGTITIRVTIPIDPIDLSTGVDSTIRLYTIHFDSGYSPDPGSSMVRSSTEIPSPNNPKPISAENFAELAEIRRAIEEKSTSS